MDNYEEKYKAALGWMKGLYSGLHGATKEEAEKYFPELKEGEDERHRKWILEYLYDGLRKSDEQFKGQFKAAIAWLEKQGEQKPYGQRKECEDCQFNYVGECKGYCALKRNEHKPTDEIKPKFKVGDWIILPLGIIARIDSINSTDYQVTTTDGKICDFKISKQDNYRLWSITDAKDGDLIYVSTEIKGIQAIFHKFENGIIYFHCNLCSDFTQGGYEPSGDVKSVNPLLKEHYQRFFQKMKQAGYEWDQNMLKKLN